MVHQIPREDRLGHILAAASLGKGKVEREPLHLAFGFLPGIHAELSRIIVQIELRAQRSLMLLSADDCRVADDGGRILRTKHPHATIPHSQYRKP